MEATKRFFWFCFCMAIMFSCFCIKTSVGQSKCNSKDVKYISPLLAKTSSSDFEFFFPTEQQCLRESQTTLVEESAQKNNIIKEGSNKEGENIDTKSAKDYKIAENSKCLSESLEDEMEGFESLEEEMLSYNSLHLQVKPFRTIFTIFFVCLFLTIFITGLESLKNEFFKIKTFDLKGGDSCRGGSNGGGTVGGVGGQGGGSGGVASSIGFKDE